VAGFESWCCQCTPFGVSLEATTPER
jgi:hypothetical protein